MCAVLVLAIAYTTGLNLAALSLAAAGLALFGHLQNGRGRAVARVRAAVPGQLLFGLLAAVVRALTHASMKLRRAFGDRATMVTAAQGGHGVYPFGRNTCANNAVTAFLTNGQRLAEDLACAPARPYR